MIRNFKELERTVKGRKNILDVILVAAHDEEPLKGLFKAVKRGICKGVLVGNKRKIISLLKKEDIPPLMFRIIDSDSDEDTIAKSIDQVKENPDSLLMKGLIPTPLFMKGVLSKDTGLRKSSLITHCFVFENPLAKKFTIITDGGVVPFPDVGQKIAIIENGSELMHSFGSRRVKVALLSASEKVSKKIPSTLDAESLKRHFKARKDIRVDGPFGIDIAISKRSAEHKGVDTFLAGSADILLAPNVEAGNMTAKAILYFAKVRAGGVILGARIPIILLSRADDAEAKFNSILLGVHLASRRSI